MSWVENNEWLSGSQKGGIHWAAVRRFCYQFRLVRRQIVLTAVLALFSSLTAFFVPPVLRALEKALIADDMRMVAVMLAAFLGVLLWQPLLGYYISRLQAYVSTRLTQELLLQYYRKLLNISIHDFVEFRRRSNIFQRMMDATMVTNEFTSSMIQSLRAVIMIAAFVIVIGAISMTALGIVAIGALALFLFVYSQGTKLREKRQAFLAVNYPLVEKMLEAIEGLFTIKALASSVRVTSDIERLVRERTRTEREETVAQAYVTQVSSVISSCIITAALTGSSVLLVHHRMDYAGLLSLYLLVGFLIGPIVDLARSYQNLSPLSVNLKNYYQVIDLNDETPSAIAYIQEANGSGKAIPLISNGHGPLLPVKNAAQVEFCNVTFGYSEAQPLFEGLNFEIQPGEKVSLVGRSGVGKTTLLRLAMAFLKPQRGTILIDGIDTAKTPDLNALRRLFGIVSQQDFFFGTTIRENLLFGLEDVCSDHELTEVLGLLDLWSCVNALPQKLDTVYSHYLLSGGQKQRLFIARALLRKPKIILLDEPTSALDFENESRVIRAVETLAKGRTTITVAHRLSTVRSAEKVLLLKDGKVSALGTHEELYARDNYYKSFCDYNTFIV